MDYSTVIVKSEKDSDEMAAVPARLPRVNGYRTLRFAIVTKELPTTFGMTLINLKLSESLVEKSQGLLLIPQNKYGVKIKSVDEGQRGDMLGMKANDILLAPTQDGKWKFLETLNAAAKWTGQSKPFCVAILRPDPESFVPKKAATKPSLPPPYEEENDGDDSASQSTIESNEKLPAKRNETAAEESLASADPQTSYPARDTNRATTIKTRTLAKYPQVKEAASSDSENMQSSKPVTAPAEAANLFVTTLDKCPPVDEEPSDEEVVGSSKPAAGEDGHVKLIVRMGRGRKTDPGSVKLREMISNLLTQYFQSSKKARKEIVEEIMKRFMFVEPDAFEADPETARASIQNRFYDERQRQKTAEQESPEDKETDPPKVLPDSAARPRSLEEIGASPSPEDKEENDKESGPPKVSPDHAARPRSLKENGASRRLREIIQEEKDEEMGPRKVLPDRAARPRFLRKNVASPRHQEITKDESLEDEEESDEETVPRKVLPNRAARPRSLEENGPSPSRKKTKTNHSEHAAPSQDLLTVWGGGANSYSPEPGNVAFRDLVHKTSFAFNEASEDRRKQIVKDFMDRFHFVTAAGEPLGTGAAKKKIALAMKGNIYRHHKNGTVDEEASMDESSDQEGEDENHSSKLPGLVSQSLKKIVDKLLVEEGSNANHLDELLENKHGLLILSGANHDAIALVRHDDSVDVQRLGWSILASNLKYTIFGGDVAERFLLNLGVASEMVTALEKSTTAASLDMLMGTCEEIFMKSDALMASFVSAPNSASALSSAVNALDEESGQVDTRSYQTWMYLLKQVTTTFTDDGKDKFIDGNGLGAVWKVKQRSKNVAELEKVAVEVVTSLLNG